LDPTICRDYCLIKKGLRCKVEKTNKSLKKRKKRPVAEHHWFGRPPNSALNVSGLPPPLSDLAVGDDHTQREAGRGAAGWADARDRRVAP
jgi:hypothetical protein